MKTYNRSIAIAGLGVIGVISVAGVLAVLLLAAGCGKTPSPTGPPPSFSLSWSEYPSWSVFGVADERGLIDGEKGRQGPLEKKHNVDIVLQQADYDSCMTQYASGAADAVCITNMDVLNLSLSRKAVAIMPTSRSEGADALIVLGVDTVEDLKDHKVYGLSKSVSEYVFVRNLEELGKNPAEFEFVNMDPQAAATAMQTGEKGINAIMVWNPFVMQTLKTKPGSKVMFDSSSIPAEIIDMVVMSQDSLSLPGGADFARAIAEAYYEICKLMADPAKEDSTLVALGAKFSNLDAESMRTVVKQTLFYSDPGQAEALFEGAALKATMEKVVGFCRKNRIIMSDPIISYDRSRVASNLIFDTQYLRPAE